MRPEASCRRAAPGLGTRAAGAVALTLCLGLLGAGPVAADPPAPDTTPAPVPAPYPGRIEAWLADPRRPEAGPDGQTRLIYRPEFQPAPLLLGQVGGLGIPGLHLELTTPLISAALPPKGPRPPPQPSRILLRGPPGAVAQGLARLEHLDRPPASVEVRGLVFEVRCHDRRESGGALGVEATGPDDGGGNLFRGFGHAYEPPSELAVRMLGARPFEGTNLTFAAAWNSGRFDATLRALAKRGEAAYLARPRLVLTEGRPARLEVLRTLSVPVVEETASAPVTTLAEVQVGMKLGLLAVRVGAEGALVDVDLWLRVPEQSEDPRAPVGTVLLRERHLTTRVTLRAGQPALLGGLFLRRLGNGRAGLPALGGAAPWLDPLLSRRDRGGERSELLVALEARTVRPAPGPPAEPAAAGRRP